MYNFKYYYYSTHKPLKTIYVYEKNRRINRMYVDEMIFKPEFYYSTEKRCSESRIFELRVHINKNYYNIYLFTPKLYFTREECVLHRDVLLDNIKTLNLRFSGVNQNQSTS